MKQLILPDSYKDGEVAILSEADSHYLLRVQRKEIGYSLDLLDKNGEKFKGTISDIINGLCHLTLKKSTMLVKKSSEIILLQSIPKGKKIDLMIRQAVETGVSTIVPIMAEHSVPKFKNQQEKDKKRERWNKIIKEASQQSGTDNVTTLEPLKTFEEALSSLPQTYTGIFFHQIPLSNEPLHKILSKPEETIVLVIGPEGGISKKEVETLLKYGFKPALLGKNILRAETATTFSLGAVQMILNEKDYWIVK